MWLLIVQVFFLAFLFDSFCYWLKQIVCIIMETLSTFLSWESTSFVFIVKLLNLPNLPNHLFCPWTGLFRIKIKNRLFLLYTLCKFISLFFTKTCFLFSFFLQSIQVKRKIFLMFPFFYTKIFKIIITHINSSNVPVTLSQILRGFWSSLAQFLKCFVVCSTDFSSATFTEAVAVRLRLFFLLVCT